MQRDAERIYDEYLVASAQAGDRPSWERLVARWHPRLLRHAWRLTGHRERAADAVQDGWIEICRGLRRLDDVAAFPAWALRIVTRRCQRQFALGDRERAVVDAWTDDAEGLAGDDGSAAESASDLARVRAAMACLPPPQRAALALHYLEGLGVAEIAIALDIPPGTVKTRLMHARNKVRAFLEGVPHVPE